MKKLYAFKNKILDRGISIVVLSDICYPDITGDIISVIHHGRIIRDYPTEEFDPDVVSDLLADCSGISNCRSLDSHRSITGVLELESYDKSLREYISSINIADWSILKDSSKTQYISSSSEKLCTNLSIGENIALVRYSKITTHGVVEKEVLHYFENQFNQLLVTCGSKACDSISDMSHVDRRILGIERWVLAGRQFLIIQDPCIGLDAKGRQIFKRYLINLSERGIQCLLVFYNESDFMDILSRIYVRRCGVRES